MIKQISLLTACGGLLLASVSLGAGTKPGPEDQVRPLRPELYRPVPPAGRASQFLAAYYDSILDWDKILLEQARPARGMKGCLNYGLESNVENDVRPIAYAALVNAFLAEFAPPPDAVAQASSLQGEGRQDARATETRARMRAEAEAALRYLVRSHVSGGGACSNGKPWGDQWQSAMWARSAGLAGWILWPRLDRELRRGVARLVEHEAGRFLKAMPKSSERRDTGAEENAWNAQILTLACNMMPGHPRAAQWAEAAKSWMYNTLSAAADRGDATPGDDGRAIRDWVRTVNVHPDFTVENHGLVHVGYLKTSLALLLENSVPYLLAGQDVPRACLHHAADCFGVAQRLMGWDGEPVFFSGNDWKLFHSQNADLMIYTFMGLQANDRAAARLEETALPWLQRMQRAENGYYNVRRDIEYGGMCATRLISCYLARVVLGGGPAPITPDEFERSIQGVTRLQYGKTIVHRTPGKFASFCWASKRMALSLPRNGAWVIWPHFASGTGLIGRKDASEENARLVKVVERVTSDSFTVTLALDRMKGAVRQTIGFASPASDMTIYIERIEPRAGTKPTPRETGVIGLEYELGENTRTLYGAQGKTAATGLGGERPRVLELKTDWLNIDNRVGYVVKRVPERANLMRYHDEVKGSGRVPVLQEWLSLIGESTENPNGSAPEWACLVTFLNQQAEDTRQWRGRVEFTVSGDVAECRIGGEIVRADFGRMTTRINSSN